MMGTKDFRKPRNMYRAVTRQIEVTVEPNFLPERSSVDKGQYFWSYTIVITNTGAETVQLRTRHWTITDATGRKQEVRGEGVVGEQPVLAPGERFEYTSGVPLPTASGIMALSGLPANFVTGKPPALLGAIAAGPGRGRSALVCRIDQSNTP